MPPSQSNPTPSFTNFFVFLSALSISVAIALAVLLIRGGSGETTLAQLSADDRLQLLEQAQTVSPAVYQPFPPSSPMLFYRMKPNTNYQNVLGDNFKTNELGFRAITTFPKPARTRRVLIVGDSWTYGPFVSEAETFSSVLSKHLNASGQQWQVYNLAMLGWNTDNELSALWTFLGQIKPDLVVICPTSNDIDDSFAVWNGRLVNNGFTSSAIFRYSYEYESRWFEVFGKLQRAVDQLAARSIPTLVYFLAEWRNLAPYYAQRTGFHAKYTVVPTDYINSRYRLSSNIDFGRHPSAEGHRLIGEYLFNALIDGEYIFNMKPLPSDAKVSFPGQTFDEAKIRDEFGFWSQFADRYDLIPLDGDTMGRRGIFSVAKKPEDTSLAVKLNLLDDWTLYPLTLRFRLASADAETKELTLTKPAKNSRLTLDIPDTLKTYPFVELHVDADRTILPPGKSFPVSMKRPDISAK